MSSLCECQLHLGNTPSADCHINAFNCQTARLICTKCTFAKTHIYINDYIYILHMYIFTFINL